MKKLWQKNWKLDTTIEAFETKGDLLLDQQLLPYDVLGSLAHAAGLKKIGIITAAELSLIRKGLNEILLLDNQKKFQLNPGDEDIHSKIENYLTDSYGAIGKKIHTGRSRNDQVLTAIRLLTKNQLLTIWEELLQLTDAFLLFAKQYEDVLMPGYTHMQKAMPSTVGMWASAFAEGLLDSLQSLKTAFLLNDQSPLGSAAGYGIPLPLDREYTAALLGFTTVQMSPIYCQNSRGKIEATVVAALISILQDINKFASDVLLFTTSEFGFFEVAKEVCSGSSIMPQKKNVDVAELLRSKVHVLLGNYTQLISMSANIISGYNRDVQDSKKPLFESLETTVDCLSVSKLLVQNISINQEKTQRALTPELFATHYAIGLVGQGIPFREAYQQTAKAIGHLQYQVEDVFKEPSALGGIGNTGLKMLAKQYVSETKLLQTEKQKWMTVNNNLLKETNPPSLKLRRARGGEKT